MENFILFVTVAAAALQIILFFKVWAMTNDVAKIKNNLSASQDLLNARVAYMLGNKVKAKELLDASFYGSIINDWVFYHNHEGDPESYADVMRAIERYKSSYKEMGFEMPDVNVKKFPFEKFTL